MRCSFLHIIVVLVLILTSQPCLNIRLKLRWAHAKGNRTSIGEAANKGKQEGDHANTDTKRPTKRPTKRTLLGHEKLVIVVRHGESVGNIYSDSMKHAKSISEFTKQAFRLAKDKMWRGAKIGAQIKEYKKGSQWLAFWDSPLSSNGLGKMRELGEKLFGPPSTPGKNSTGRKEDKYGIFSACTELGAQQGITVMFSPLRRAVWTMIEVVGIPIQRILSGNNIRFEASPFAHERQDSLSDVGSPTDELIKYVDNEWSWYYKSEGKDVVLKAMQESIQHMERTWYKNAEFYQHNYEDTNSSSKQEDIWFFSKRMHSLMRSIAQDDNQIIILVAHSKVIQFLFKDFFTDKWPSQKVENGGVLAGIFSHIKGQNAYSYGKNWELDYSGFNDQDHRFPWEGINTADIEFLTTKDQKSIMKDTFEEALLQTMDGWLEKKGEDMARQHYKQQWQNRGLEIQEEESKFSEENFIKELQDQQNRITPIHVADS